MKNLFLIIFIVALSFAPIEANDNMLFPQYKEGFAILIGGARAITKFNYDKVEERMLFIDVNNTSLILSPSDVVAVIIGERTFVPAGSNDAFKERISVGDNQFYVRHRAKTHTAGAFVFGTNVETRRVSMSGAGSLPAHSRGPAFGLGSGGGGAEFAPTHRATVASEFLSDESVIFIHDGNRFVRINSLRSLSRQFRPQQTQIERFARTNNTDFRNVEDVKAIVIYALSL